MNKHLLKIVMLMVFGGMVGTSFAMNYYEKGDSKVKRTEQQKKIKEFENKRKKVVAQLTAISLSAAGLVLAADAGMVLCQISAQLKLLTATVKVCDKMGLLKVGLFKKLADYVTAFELLVHDSAFNIFGSHTENHNRRAVLAGQILVGLAACGVIAIASLFHFLRSIEIIGAKVNLINEKIGASEKKVTSSKKKGINLYQKKYDCYSDVFDDNCDCGGGVEAQGKGLAPENS